MTSTQPDMSAPEPEPRVTITIMITGRGGPGVDTRILQAPLADVVDHQQLMARAAAAFPEFTTTHWETEFPVDPAAPTD